MKLKTYRASSMADALAAVKKDLGRDAVILHTRQVKAGGLLGFRRRTLVEVTASDQPPKALRSGDPAASGQRRSNIAKGPAPGDRSAELQSLLGSMAAKAYGAPPQATSIQPSPPASVSSVISDPKPTAATAESSSKSAGPNTPAATPSPSSAQEPTRMVVRQRRSSDESGACTPPPASPGNDRLFRELSDIKLMVSQVLQSAPVGSMTQAGSGDPTLAPLQGHVNAALPSGAMPPPLFDQYLRLLEAAVSRDIADCVIGAVRDELAPSELADAGVVRTAVLRHLAALIPIAEPVARPGATPDGRPLTIALVGPTGVGKTTTIAKLAASYKLRQGRSVALVTTDTYRIAAVDQLRTYATILGVPLKVVQTAEEVEHALAALANFQVVLIDTAGRSQHACDRLGELAQFLAAALPHETHLVLSSTASESVLVRTAESFQAAGVRFNRLILSKLDEAVNFGVLVNVARRISARLAFVTTGQEVPEHIEPSRADRLARMILDNALPTTPTPAGRNTGARASTPLQPVPTPPAADIAVEHAALLAAPVPA